jgi:cytosine/adenosine deaminase-related metal-dependent hydrolase
MAYHNNAEIARLFWPAMKGTLEMGQPADVIVMDYKPFTPLTAGNLPWHLLFGMTGGMVTHTICNGKMLMADRKLLALDEAEIAAKAKEAAVRTWERVEAL